MEHTQLPHFYLASKNGKTKDNLSRLYPINYIHISPFSIYPLPEWSRRSTCSNQRLGWSRSVRHLQQWGSCSSPSSRHGQEVRWEFSQGEGVERILSLDEYNSIRYKLKLLIYSRKLPKESTKACLKSYQRCSRFRSKWRLEDSSYQNRTKRGHFVAWERVHCHCSAGVDA